MTTRDIQRMAKRTGRTISVNKGVWFRRLEDFTNETSYGVSIFSKNSCEVDYFEQKFETLKEATIWVKQTLKKELENA